MDRERKDTAVPQFFVKPVENKSMSEKEGRPIFEDKEMITIRIPGDRNFTWDGEVTDEHRRRFPEAYEAFKRGEQRAASGTPLEEWPVLTRSRVMELKVANIYTVEEYATIPDNALEKLGMNSRAEREKARTFLEAAKGAANPQALAAEVERLRQQLNAALGQPQAAAQPQPVQAEAPTDKDINDCTDDELKDWLRKHGASVRGRLSRETLLSRVKEVAERQKEAA